MSGCIRQHKGSHHNSNSSSLDHYRQKCKTCGSRNCCNNGRRKRTQCPHQQLKRYRGRRTFMA
eukprot:1652919-Ditylum_brightwellii.AAC.1